MFPWCVQTFSLSPTFLPAWQYAANLNFVTTTCDVLGLDEGYRCSFDP
jgi:hypothetical protein